MKKIIFSALLAVFALQATAQTGTETTTTVKQKPTLEERAEKFASKVQRETGIDDATKQKVYDLRLEKVKKIKEIRDANQGDKEAMKAAAKPIAKEFNTELKGLMTDLQWEKWKNVRKTERAKTKAAIERRKAAKTDKQPRENPVEDDDYMDGLEEDQE